jgi:signal transduction histidine kinase
MDFNNANISSLLLERFASFKTIAEEKNIQFSLGMPDQEVFAVVDVDAMHKILNNLFTNALNYSEKNVFVRLSVLAEQDRFMIEFSNDGNLIPDNMKEMIFEPFFRIKETSQITGTGIGLALSRSLAEMHKGEIYLKERGNDMNNFVLIIPMNYNIANEF